MYTATEQLFFFLVAIGAASGVLLIAGGIAWCLDKLWLERRRTHYRIR